MSNVSDICSVSCQIGKISEKICSYASAINERGGAVSDDLADVYEELLLDEIKQGQILMLKLTDLVTEQDENADEDGSAFAEGELNSNLGEKKQNNPAGKEV